MATLAGGRCRAVPSGPAFSSPGKASDLCMQEGTDAGRRDRSAQRCVGGPGSSSELQPFGCGNQLLPQCGRLGAGGVWEQSWHWVGVQLGAPSPLIPTVTPSLVLLFCPLHRWTFRSSGAQEPARGTHEPPFSLSPPSCWKPPAAASDICLNQRKGLGPRTFRGLSPAQTLPRAAGVRRKKCHRCLADSHRDTRESCLGEKQDDSPLRHRRLQTSACRTRCSIPTGRGARPAVGPALLLERGKGTRVVLCAENSGT